MRSFRKSLRLNVACVAGALCVASFTTHTILFFAYFSSHPRQPDPELGLVYKLNNHGSYLYLTNTESTGLTLLMDAFLVGLFVTLVVVPKKPLLPPPGTPRWITRVSGAAKIDLRNATPSMKVVPWVSIIFYLTFIFLFGRAIVVFAVSRGIVLSAW
jgi:hypothetical protein